MRKRHELTVGELLEIWPVGSRDFFLTEHASPIQFLGDWVRKGLSADIPSGMKVVVWENISTEWIEVNAKAIGRKVAASEWTIDYISIDSAQTHVWIHNEGMTNRELLFDHGARIEVLK